MSHMPFTSLVDYHINNMIHTYIHTIIVYYHIYSDSLQPWAHFGHLELC